MHFKNVITGVLFVLATTTGCSKKESAGDFPEPLRTIEAHDITLDVYDFEHLQPLFESNTTSKIRVINFWATWCKPCIAELPVFERINNELNADVEVILISLDFPDQLQTRLIPFIETKNLKATVLYLDDPYGDIWIPKVSENWSGAIPATFIISPKAKAFYERSFDYEALKNTILNF